MKAIDELAKEALQLPPVQRLILARILLDLSVETTDLAPDADAAWEEEICRRIEQVKSGSARSSSFDEVFARLDQRFPG